MGGPCLSGEMMVEEFIDGGCYSKALVGVNVTLALVDGFIAVLAFYQLTRIHSRTSHRGWTRQKVFHLMIGSSNVGYALYFVLSLIAACKSWSCWSNSCGFIAMACPKILFFAAFLLLLSFWVDLCHQANDEEEDDNSPQEPLLQKANKPNLKIKKRRRFCSFRVFPVGSRQQVVILVTLLIFIVMMASAVLIWIGLGKNPIDSSVVARVYVDLFAIAMLLLGGALACYGFVLVSKMSKVRSERAFSEMWKVAGLATVSVVCFTSSAVVAIFTDIPVLYHCNWRSVGGAYASVLLILYYFIGSSVPSAFVLWIMRELPPSIVVNKPEESRTIAFISDSSVTPQPQCWTAIASAQNQVLCTRLFFCRSYINSWFMYIGDHLPAYLQIDMILFSGTGIKGKPHLIGIQQLIDNHLPNLTSERTVFMGEERVAEKGSELHSLSWKLTEAGLRQTAHWEYSRETAVTMVLIV